MSDNREAAASQEKSSQEITRELVQQVADRVWQLWQEQLRLERERNRQS